MTNRTCTVEGCEKAYAAIGFCEMHRQRWKKTGEVGDALPTRAFRIAPNETCAAEACDGKVKALKVCAMHYARLSRHGSLDLPKRDTARPPEIVCTACGESKPAGDFPAGRRRCASCRAAYGKRYRDDTREERRVRGAAYWRANKEVLAEYHRVYRAENREVVRVRTRRSEALRKSRLAKAGWSNMTQAGLVARVAYYGGVCWICRVAPWEHLDHVKPLSKGGPNILSNIRPACAHCNRSKAARWPFSRTEVA